MNLFLGILLMVVSAFLIYWGCVAITEIEKNKRKEKNKLSEKELCREIKKVMEMNSSMEWTPSDIHFSAIYFKNELGISTKTARQLMRNIIAGQNCDDLN